MRFRRRRRGRTRDMLKFHPLALLTSVLAIALLVVVQSASSLNIISTTSDQTHRSDPRLNLTRQLFKRQSDDHFHHATTATENLDQQINTNHHEEPLALASSDELNSSQDSNQQQATRQNKGKRTLYACEEKQLEIECQLGESIQLIRANYGRFSIQICNEHGQLDWKVNCMSSDSFKTIAESCQSKQSCQLLASNEIFGDACPGTQKYLEVHYQCVPANRTQSSLDQQQPKVNQQSGPKPATIKTGNDVIQLNAATTTTTTTATTTTNTATASTSTAASPSEIQARLNWSVQVNAPPSPSWPNWFPPLTGGMPAGSPLNPFEAPNTPVPRSGQCPELNSRGMRWPETPAGSLAHTACPSHAQPSDPTVRPAGAVALYCRPDGQWASRVQMLGRCQSLWLRQLANRLETGDSPLSILSELVHRTSPVTPPELPAGGAASAARSSHSQPANWLAYATSSLRESMSKLPAGQTNSPLFGEDLVQMSRIVGKLVEELGELLARISDDKQRITFARDMIQLIVDLTSNLMDQHHADAWWDLASTSSGASLTGDRQRVAGQLLGALEGGSVLLAGAIQHLAHPPAADQADQSQQLLEDFQKLTEHVYVAIQPIPLDRTKASQRLQVTFPSQTSLMGARWIDSEQRFTLNLQVSSEQLDQLQAGKAASGQRQLKIVSVMLRGLDAYMDPGVLQQQHLVQDTSDKSKFQGATETSSKRLTVNSDLVGLSIVAEQAAAQGSVAATRVDLAAPVELVFRHRHSGQQQPPTSRPPVCVFWDAPTSDWSTSGCTLAASNKTHSVCACNHLTTFGLLSELDQRQTTATTLLASSGDAQQQQPTSGLVQNQQQQPRPIRVHLDRVEDELPLGAGGSEQSIYMARLLDGDLFSGHAGSRTLLYVSCCLSGLLLALLLAAAAYNKAHARRLLGSLPAEAPPSLLVANYHNQRHYQAELHAANSIETSTTTNGASPPASYSSSAGANHHHLHLHQAGGSDLLTSNKHQEQHGNELNGFYSLTFNQDHSNYYGINPQGRQQQQQFKSRAPSRSQSNDAQRYLAANNSISQLALVPCHLIVQQLLMQLLLLVLIESQNLLAWNSQQGREMLARDNLLLMDFSPQQPRADTQLDPLNWVTWSAAFALYYLASTLVCWLLTCLVQLSCHLIKLDGFHPATTKSNTKPHQTIRTISSNALYQPPPQPINRYGQCQIHHNASSSSPSLSNGFPDVLAPGAEASHLAKEPTAGGTSPSCSLASPLAARLATSKQLARLLTHVLPLLSAGLLLWSSLERGHSINQAAFTLSWSSQLVYWPLALEAGWPVPLAVYLYCLPGICLALGVVVLLMLRRHLSHFYSTAANQMDSHTTAGGPMFKQSPSGCQPEADPDNVQTQTRRRPAAAAILELSLDSKRAKLTCLTLLALLALSSICWISFFTHCHQALGQASRSNANPAIYSNHLILAFASSNLLISLLICCSQRKQVKRASQLLGLTRLLGLVAGYCCCCCRQLVEANQTSPSSSSVSSSTYYHNNQGRCGANGGQHYGTAQGKSMSKAGGGVSQQSLFALSHSRPELASQRPTYNPQAYSALQHQMLADQQHLYQQLAANSQQHIYDSATNLNELADHHQKQRQWNALQIMAQQQQQQQQFNQQREPMIHYTLGGRPYNEQQQFHLNQQQQFFHQPANMTLKALPASEGLQMSQGARNKPHESFMCPISAGLDSVNANAKTNPASSSGGRPQQQQQQLSGSLSYGSSSVSGEADGPLVALSQSSTPIVNRRRQELPPNQSAATFGPTHHSHMLPSDNQHQQPQRAIEHRPSSDFRGAHDNHADNQSSKQVICRDSRIATGNSSQEGRPISGHQKAQQMEAGGQEANQHHFRRANSNATGRPHGSFASNVMMDVQFDYSRRAADKQHQADEVGNIYDVANCGQVAGC